MLNVSEKKKQFTNLVEKYGFVGQSIPKSITTYLNKENIEKKNSDVLSGVKHDLTTKKICTEK